MNIYSANISEWAARNEPADYTPLSGKERENLKQFQSEHKAKTKLFQGIDPKIIIITSVIASTVSFIMFNILNVSKIFLLQIFVTMYKFLFKK